MTGDVRLSAQFTAFKDSYDGHELYGTALEHHQGPHAHLSTVTATSFSFPASTPVEICRFLDMMADIVITTVRRYAKGRPLKIAEQVWGQLSHTAPGLGYHPGEQVTPLEEAHS